MYSKKERFLSKLMVFLVIFNMLPIRVFAEINEVKSLNRSAGEFDINSYNISNFKRDDKNIYEHSGDYASKTGDVAKEQGMFFNNIFSDIYDLESDEFKDRAEESFDSFIGFNEGSQSINKQYYDKHSEVFDSKYVDIDYELSNEEIRELLRVYNNPFIEYHLVDVGGGKYNLIHFNVRSLDRQSLSFKRVNDENLEIKQVILDGENIDIKDEINLDISEIKYDTSIKFIYDISSNYEEKNPRSINDSNAINDKFIAKNEVNYFIHKDYDHNYYSASLLFENGVRVNNIRRQEAIKNPDKVIGTMLGKLVETNGDLLTKSIETPKAGDRNPFSLMVNDKILDVLFISDDKFLIYDNNEIVGYSTFNEVKYNLYGDSDAYLGELSGLYDSYYKKVLKDIPLAKDKNTAFLHDKVNMFSYKYKENLKTNLPKIVDTYVLDLKLLKEEQVRNISITSDSKVDHLFSNPGFFPNKISIESPDVDNNVTYNMNYYNTTKAIYKDYTDKAIVNTYGSHDRLDSFDIEIKKLDNSFENELSVNINYYLKDFDNDAVRHIASKKTILNNETAYSAAENFEDRGFKLKEFQLLDEEGNRVDATKEDLKKIPFRDLANHTLDLVFDIKEEGSFVAYYEYDSGSIENLLSKKVYDNKSDFKLEDFLNPKTHRIKAIKHGNVVEPIDSIEDIDSFIKDKDYIIVVYEEEEDVCNIQRGSWEDESSVDNLNYDTDYVKDYIDEFNYQSTNSFYDVVAVVENTIKYKNEEGAIAPFRINMSFNTNDQLPVVFADFDPSNQKHLDLIFRSKDRSLNDGETGIRIGNSYYYLRALRDSEVELVNVKTGKVDGYGSVLVNPDSYNYTNYNSVLEGSYNSYMDDTFNSSIDNKRKNFNRNFFGLDLIFWNSQGVEYDEVEFKVNVPVDGIKIGVAGSQGVWGESGRPGNANYYQFQNQSNFVNLLPCGNPTNSNADKYLYGPSGFLGPVGRPVIDMKFNHILLKDGEEIKLKDTMYKDILFFGDSFNKDLFFSVKNNDEYLTNLINKETKPSLTRVQFDEVLKDYKGFSIRPIRTEHSEKEYLDAGKLNNSFIEINDVKKDVEDAHGFIDYKGEKYVYGFLPNYRKYVSKDVRGWGDKLLERSRNGQPMEVDIYYVLSEDYYELLDLQIIKKDGNTDTILPGAIFKLEDAETGELVQYAISNSNGLAKFSNLKSNTKYRLVETKAPKGFRLDAEAKIIEFTPEDIEAGGKVIEVNNYRLNEAPETGTLGKAGFIIPGSILIVIAYVFKKE